MTPRPLISSFFFFNDTATTEIYTLSLHDALPISIETDAGGAAPTGFTTTLKGDALTALEGRTRALAAINAQDRKSTRLNPSHLVISYAVFCLKKKKHTPRNQTITAKTTLTPTRRI